MKNAKSMRVAGAVAALAAVGAVAASGTVATAEVARGPVDQSIEIRGNLNPRFDAPESIMFGTDLQIVNKTKPNKIGPHTFSLVEKDQLPKGKDELKRCSKLKDVCKDIAIAHELDFSTGEIGEPNVERGLTGWDALFTGAEEGDTWFTSTKDETTSRQVTAAPGKLWFLCAVHPEMQGKIQVGPAR